MLQLFDDIENPYSQSGISSASVSEYAAGMGLRVLDNNKSHDWEQLLLMVSEAGDRVAFRHLFNHFAPRIKSFLMKAGADPTMAEECSQEAMATVWNKAKLFDPTRASASTWIFTIARNKRIDAIRKIRRPEPDELTWPDEIEPAQEEALELKQQSEILADAIQNLPEKQRQLDAWITIQRSHAIANHLPVIAVNRAGYEADPSGHTAGIDFWGSSFICDAMGTIRVQADSRQASALLTSIDLQATQQQRNTWPFFRDRRIDAYQDLCKRWRDD